MNKSILNFKAIFCTVVIFFISYNCFSKDPKKKDYYFKKKIHSKYEKQGEEHDLLKDEEHYKTYISSLNKVKNITSHVSQNSNLGTTKPTFTLNSNFNHTNAEIDINKSFESWTIGGAIQQKISGTDSLAIPINLNGITTGTIINVNIQNISLKKNSDNTNLQPGFLWNVKGTFNPVSFNYTTDSVKLKQTTTNKLNYTGKIAIGYCFEGASSNWIISLGYENGTSYQASSSLSFYTPFGKSQNYYLNNEVFGAPNYQNVSVLSFSLAGGFINARDTSKKYAFAFDLYPAYSFEQKKCAILLPLYFVSGNEDKLVGLTGGVRLGYSWLVTTGQQPANTGFTAEIFISTPFNIFNSLGQ